MVYMMQITVTTEPIENGPNDKPCLIGVHVGVEGYPRWVRVYSDIEGSGAKRPISITFEGQSWKEVREAVRHYVGFGNEPCDREDIREAIETLGMYRQHRQRTAP